MHALNTIFSDSVRIDFVIFLKTLVHSTTIRYLSPSEKLLTAAFSIVNITKVQRYSVPPLFSSKPHIQNAVGGRGALYYHKGIPYFPCLPCKRNFISYWATTDHLISWHALSNSYPAHLWVPNHIWHPSLSTIILLTYNIPTWCLFYIDWTLHKGGEKMCSVIAASIAPGRYQGKGTTIYIMIFIKAHFTPIKCILSWHIGSRSSLRQMALLIAFWGKKTRRVPLNMAL